jgi:hypothetical protein
MRPQDEPMLLRDEPVLPQHEPTIGPDIAGHAHDQESGCAQHIPGRCRSRSASASSGWRMTRRSPGRQRGVRVGSRGRCGAAARAPTPAPPHRSAPPPWLPRLYRPAIIDLPQQRVIVGDQGLHQGQPAGSALCLSRLNNRSPRSTHAWPPSTGSAPTSPLSRWPPPGKPRPHQLRSDIRHALCRGPVLADRQPPDRRPGGRPTSSCPPPLRVGAESHRRPHGTARRRAGQGSA